MTAPRLDEQLCFQLYTASRLVTRAYRPLLDELGLTYPQYLVLLVLWEVRDDGTKAPTVSELGERLLLDSGTLTPLLKRMERQGLVTRTRDPEDERSVRIGLTEAGSGLSRQACAVPEQLTGGASAQDLAAVADLRDAVGQLVKRLAG